MKKRKLFNIYLDMECIRCSVIPNRKFFISAIFVVLRPPSHRMSLFNNPEIFTNIILAIKKLKMKQYEKIKNWKNKKFSWNFNSDSKNYNICFDLRQFQFAKQYINDRIFLIFKYKKRRKKLKKNLSSSMIVKF